MRFEQVPGRETIKRQLIKMADSGKPAHAMLFTGSEGNGAYPLALAYTQYLNCEAPDTGKDSCGKCNSCIKIQKLIHPDLIFSFPAVKTGSDKRGAMSKNFVNEWREFILANPNPVYAHWMREIATEGKQGNISADECNEIARQIHLKNFEAKHKVILIWLAELLGKEGNILLKSIEEPPPETLFILISNQPDSILKTILSRTQVINIPGYPDEEVAGWFQNNFGMDRVRSQQLAILSDGSLSKAAQLAREEGMDYSEIMLNWFRSVFKSDTVKINSLIDELAQLKREGQKNFLDYCSELIRATVLFKYRSNSSERISDNENKLIRFLAEKLSLGQIEDLNSSFEKLRYFIQRNANARIQFLYLYTRHLSILNK